MRQFRFALDKVLDYRKQLEEQAKLELAQARQAYAAQVELVQGVRKSLAEHEKALYQEEPNADTFWLWKQYKERLVEDLARAEQRMRALAQELSKKQRQAVIRSRDRKLLDKLKEKQKERHVREEERLEQKEFDEMATVRYEPPSL